MMNLNKKVVCADGFSMSVQAHSGGYCTPRTTGATRYTAVEVGFPSDPEELLMEYCEDRENPTETVYGWVPSQTVALVIAKHGGMVEGELPPGVAPLRSVQ
jgi:hypothetical protein